MNNRAYAIDVLRCLAIVGMVFSAQINWLRGLPAWLFHAQLPPPDFAFTPTLAGITWVDLVFPFFLFSMGAAFPLAMRPKMARGVTVTKMGIDVIKRGLILALFAILLGNTMAHKISQVGMLFTWVIFFCMFIRLPKLSPKANNYLNTAAILVSILWLTAHKYIFGLPVTLYQSDIIILVLANVAIAGSAIWYLTRENLLARYGIIAIVVALKVSSSVEGSWVETVWNWTPAPWLYRAEFLKYLCIILPGSLAGDMIWQWISRKKSDSKSSHPTHTNIAAILLTVAFMINMWGLFTRNLGVNFAATALLGIVTWRLMRRTTNSTDKLHYTLFISGLFWLLLGLIIEPFEGGIKKDHATLSYYFVTSGLASYALVVISVMLNYLRVNMNFLIRCGQNPMVAYTAANYVVIPLLALLHLNFILQWLVSLGPWFGVLKGALITLMMMMVSWGCTRAKLFWKA